MKSSAFLIFFTIVITLYSIINYIIYIRGLSCVAENSSFRLAYKISFLVIASSYIISRFLERFFINYFTNIFTWIGSFWLGAMVYILVFVILFDLLRLINYWLPYYPSTITDNYFLVKSIIFKSVLSIVAVLIVIGYFNTIKTRIVHLNLAVHKKVEGAKHLHIVMASDIHLGTVINKNRATYLVNKINSLKPDIVVFAGDLLDEVLAPVIKYNIGKILTNIKAPLGVYAITGNHEYIGGIGNACKYIEEHNIKTIRDTALLIDNRFYLAGREDRDRPRFTGLTRKTLSEVLSGTDKSIPIVLLDHQPFNLNEAVENNVDLQLSGHTHHAQFFPFSYLTQKIYELDWGYKQKANTHFYVSCGFGTWGPPMRIGSRSEIVDIHISFD